MDCCSAGVPRQRVQQLPECFPIDVAANDPFYSRFRVRCLNFLRSIPALGDGCGEQPAQQVGIRRIRRALQGLVRISHTKPGLLTDFHATPVMSSWTADNIT